MPLSKTGRKIMSAMQKEYGPKKGKEVFFASENAGTIKGGCKDASMGPELRDLERQYQKLIWSAAQHSDQSSHIRRMDEIKKRIQALGYNIDNRGFIFGGKITDRKGETMRRAFDSAQRARLHRALDRAIDRHRDRRAADSLRELAIARGQTEEAFGKDSKKRSKV